MSGSGDDVPARRALLVLDTGSGAERDNGLLGVHMISVYADPATHRTISHIIRRHSTNPDDVRSLALRDIDFSGVRKILDLGCGFGFMVEALAARAGPRAEIVCVDVHPSNRDAIAAAAGDCRARFIDRALESKLDFPSMAFDGVTASYSLYFFPKIIPEVARVMKRDGFFVSLTHSRLQFRGLLAGMGLAPDCTALHALVSAFCVENGAGCLAEHFAEVTVRPYHNHLVFTMGDMDDYLALVRFKLPSLRPAEPAAGCSPGSLLARARRLLEAAGRVVIEKDDAVFICRKPRLT